MIVSLDHIQIALPEGAEGPMRAFYCDLLGMTEVEKPDSLAGRGGFWAEGASIQVHFGVDPVFRPATKAHAAFIVAELGRLVRRLQAAGHVVTPDDRLAGVERVFTADPVGNRIELIAERADRSAS